MVYPQNTVDYMAVAIIRTVCSPSTATAVVFESFDTLTCDVSH